ncbi:MAG: DUF1801 domain-containing protein [Anaerolineales bacterium]|nr:DUF1801 domain-containing protein [Anaerolineales bacterium]
MQSKAKDVTSYLKEVPEERKAALLKLRELCIKHLTGFEEAMLYGGPTYSRNGVAEVGFMSQKNYIGLYILRTDVMMTHRSSLNIKGVTMGKGCIRYPKAEKIDFDVVAKMLKDTVKSTGPVC